MTLKLNPLSPPRRLLLGPGPSEVSPEVLDVLSTPLLGHLDPDFLKIMDEIKAGLREIFRTGNSLTLPISGTGSAGMEAAVSNMVEPGDRAVIGASGYFGLRLAEMCRRRGADVVTVEAPWGRPVDPGEMARTIASGPTRVAGIVHAETSTGVLQPLEEISAASREAGALLLVDTVTSLGGLPVEVDKLGIDAAWSASQKCLSAPPGAAPVTFSGRAVDRLEARKTAPPVWNLDLRLLEKYWAGKKRAYHHTAPISTFYALREAIRLALDEGLEARWERHASAGRALVEGAASLGLEPLVEERWRLPMLTTLRVPEGTDADEVRFRLLEEDGIEIAGGLGPLTGRIWRVGLMGHSARRVNVEKLLEALKRILKR